MTKELTDEEKAEAKAEERGKELISLMTNKQKREAVKFFDANFEDLDGMDMTVLLAHIADPSKTLEELDAMPMADVQKVALGE